MLLTRCLICSELTDLQTVTTKLSPRKNSKETYLASFIIRISTVRVISRKDLPQYLPISYLTTLKKWKTRSHTDSTRKPEIRTTNHAGVNGC